MVDIAKLKVGDKVFFTNRNNTPEYENGIVKEIPKNTVKSVRVVYNCAGN